MPVPTEDVGGRRDAGIVHLVRLTDGEIVGDEVLTQRSPLHADDAEPGDRFGAWL